MKISGKNKLEGKKNKVIKSTNLIIIDASGSMGSKIEDVKGGLKQILEDIKKDAQKDKGKKEIQTIVLDFSDARDIRTLVNTKDCKHLEPNMADGYSVRGSTALFDAIGKGFSMVDSNDKNVFVSIITDGGENASREFSGHAIKQLISEKRERGWAITFMGTDEQAIEQARSFGITSGNTFMFANNSAGVSLSMNKVLKSRKMSYSAAGGQGFGSEGADLKYRGSVGTDAMENLLKEEDDNS